MLSESDYQDKIEEFLNSNEEANELISSYLVPNEDGDYGNIDYSSDLPEVLCGEAWEFDFEDDPFEEDLNEDLYDVIGYLDTSFNGEDLKCKVFTCSHEALRDFLRIEFVVTLDEESIAVLGLVED